MNRDAVSVFMKVQKVDIVFPAAVFYKKTLIPFFIRKTQLQN